jgi:flagellum-specific ATP synthase
LVEGDDHNEPISDSVRSILDGHIVLARQIAERNRYPAIDVLRSISRTMPHCNGERENALIDKARLLISTYEDMAELIRIGAYKRGSDAAIDEAIHYYPLLEKFLTQRVDQHVDMAASYAELASVLGVDWEEQSATGENGSELDDKGDKTCDP